MSAEPVASSQAEAGLDLATQRGVGRASYSPKEIAARNACSESFVREAIAQGRLIAHPLGGWGPLRVTPEAELLWIRGQRTPSDPPVIGVPETKAASYGARRRGT